MRPALKKLSNGLPAIFVPQKGAESMTLMAFARVGSRYETRDINGASHFVEHLMFKGTRRRPTTLDISKELDRYGAEYNAFTSKDLTAYYIKMDAAKTPLAVDLLHDMIFHSRYDPKEIERERGVIIEEINMYEDNPRMHIEDLLEEALFPDSTLGWNIAGPREVIRKITPGELTDYRDRYYIPSRMVVVAAGKIAPGIMGLLEKTFGTVKEPMAKRDAPFLQFAAPKRLANPIAFQTKKTEQVQLGMAFHGFPFGDARVPAASLLATILGSTMSSRLFIEVRERRGLCYSISASHQPLEDTGVFSILSGLEKSRVDEAVKIIWQELRKIARTPVGRDELARAKDNIRGKLALAFEDSSTQADYFGKQWTFERKIETPVQRLRKIDRVTASQVREVAKTLFRKDIMAAALIGPFEHGKELKSWFGLKP